MSDTSRRVAGLDAVAHELDRWSAYASGALDDARVRHRHVREHVRRAERTLALAETTLERDGAALADVTGQLERLTQELDQLTRALGERGMLNAQLIETAREIRTSADVAVRENLRRQESAASAVSTAARDEQRARAVLHRALDEQRIAFKRRLRRAAQQPAARQVASAESEARRTHEVHAQVKHELAILRSAHERLQAEAEAIDLEIAEAEAATARLVSASRALHEGRQALGDARAAHDHARAAHLATNTSVTVMRTHAADAAGRLEQAAVWERDATGTYEDVQQLTTDTALSLRDLLELAGAERRATQAVTARPRP